jgi:glycine reductase complex component B subunit gamma
MQAGANRVVQGVKIEHVCGDPALPPEADRALRRRIVEQALMALGTDVEQPTLVGAV